LNWLTYIIKILLISPPLSYPIPLLSLTTHLALLSTRLPALKSDPGDDPLFNDDWDAAVPLYPRSSTKGKSKTQYSNRPPVTLLVMLVGLNIIFDPTKEELSVADAVLAVSLTSSSLAEDAGITRLRVLSIRTIDPPSRLTTAGIPDALNTATGGAVTVKQEEQGGKVDGEEPGVWRPPRGGMKRGLIGKVVEMCLKKGGVGEEVLAGLEGVDVG
jgi:exosome complex component RRP42